MGRVQDMDLLTWYTPYYLPIKPLQDVIETVRVEQGLEEIFGRNAARVIYDAMKSGWIQYLRGDEVSCTLGYHPSQIWGERWFYPYIFLRDWRDRCKADHQFSLESIERYRTPSGVLRMICLRCVDDGWTRNKAKVI